MMGIMFLITRGKDKNIKNHHDQCTPPYFCACFNLMTTLLSGKSQRSNRFELRFRTEAENGLVLWLSRGQSLQADYFALAIVHSRLELSFNLGKQSSFLSARSMVIYAQKS